LNAVAQSKIDPDHVAAALAEFNELWDVLYPLERSRIVRSLIATVTCQARGDVRIALNPGATCDLVLDREATANLC